MTLSRQSLLDGSFSRMLREADPTGMLLSDEARNLSLAETLARKPRRAPAPGAGAPDDVWVFAYGSLIWNPAFHFVERRLGTVHGWHRQFCLWTPLGRGTTDNPGLMLGLERGGACRGVAFRIAAADVSVELELLWRREMVSGAYAPRWTHFASPEGKVDALAFTINRHHERYARAVPEDRMVSALATAAGRLGKCCDYLFQTAEHLDALGIHDRMLHHLRRLVVAEMDRRGAG